MDGMAARSRSGFADDSANDRVGVPAAGIKGGYPACSPFEIDRRATLRNRTRSPISCGRRRFHCRCSLRFSRSRSGSGRCTRSNRAMARRWWPPIWWARAAPETCRIAGRKRYLYAYGERVPAGDRDVVHFAIRDAGSHSRILGIVSGISIVWIGAMLLWRRARRSAPGKPPRAQPCPRTRAYARHVHAHTHAHLT